LRLTLADEIRSPEIFFQLRVCASLCPRPGTALAGFNLSKPPHFATDNRWLTFRRNPASRRILPTTTNLHSAGRAATRNHGLLCNPLPRNQLTAPKSRRFRDLRTARKYRRLVEHDALRRERITDPGHGNVSTRIIAHVGLSGAFGFLGLAQDHLGHGRQFLLVVTLAEGSSLDQRASRFLVTSRWIVLFDHREAVAKI
jgi:hypothetical protein